MIFLRITEAMLRQRERDAMFGQTWHAIDAKVPIGAERAAYADMIAAKAGVSRGVGLEVLLLMRRSGRIKGQRGPLGTMYWRED